MGMKYKDPVTGQLKEISLKAADTLPIGTIVDYDGEDVPEGWEEYGTDDYSTDETFTGKHWIDGKPIYRKIVTGTLPSLQPSSGGTADGNVAHGISDFDSLVSINGKMLYGSTWYTFPILSSNQKMTAIRTVNSTNIVVRAADSWQVGYQVHFAIEYTKTTD